MSAEGSRASGRGWDAATALLVAGMLAGAVLAAVSVVGGAGAVVATGPAGDGRAVVAEADFERALRAVGADRREPLGPDEARHVLERLVDEDLLVRHGLAIGLAERDPRVRAELSAAVIGLIVERAEAEADAATEAELRTFYEARADVFQGADAYRLAAVFVAERLGDGGGSARVRIEALRARLVAGESMESVAPEADAPVVELPRGWISADTVLEYLGPSAASAVGGLGEGGVSEVIEAGGGYWVVVVEGVRGSGPPAFEAVEEQVRAAYRAWVGDEALQRFLREQRRGVEVVVR